MAAKKTTNTASPDESPAMPAAPALPNAEDAIASLSQLMPLLPPALSPAVGPAPTGQPLDPLNPDASPAVGAVPASPAVYSKLRPGRTLTRALFEKLCMLQCSIAEITGYTGITERQLSAWCRKVYHKSLTDIMKMIRMDGLILLRCAGFTNMCSGKSATFLNQQYNRYIADTPPETGAPAALQRFIGLAAVPEAGVRSLFGNPAPEAGAPGMNPAAPFPLGSSSAAPCDPAALPGAISFTQPLDPSLDPEAADEDDFHEA